jgi:ubiquinone/menaquinone biosynthesis C-methylase UbiE
MSESDSFASHSSTGHRLSNANFIDAHYMVCQASYEAMLRAVGIQPGWHVLDAGCGSGSFLPLMAELVGPHGSIAAFDLAPENIERVNILAQELDAPIKAQIGSITKLPYADHTFDAIWNANVTQYLTDDEMTLMLNEFVRVVKPGGVVAIKESDTTTIQFYPLDRFVYWRFEEKEVSLQPGFLRVLNLPRWLKNAGLVDVTQATFLEEIRAPLPASVHAFMAGSLQFFAKEAESLGLSEADMEHWRRCREPSAPDNPVNHPDFYFREGMTLVVGTKAAGR